MFDITFPNMNALLYVPLVVSTLALIWVYAFRLRRFRLIAKHASWQIEAQDIEVATHDAITTNAEGAYPYISVVVPINEQSSDVLYLLRALFKQNYRGQFEVVLADESHSINAISTFEEQRKKHPNLRYTFVPKSSRYIELRKLAITLGIKASRGEWVIVVNPETVPMSNEWMQCFAENLGESVNYVEAYYNYEDDGSIVARRAIFERIDHFSSRIYAWEKGIIVGCMPANWAVRKQWFIKENGFADSLNLAFGEEAIFASRNVEAENYLMLCSPATRLIEELPSKSTLSVFRFREAEIRRHLTRRARYYQSSSVFTCFMAYAFALCLLFYTVMRVLTVAEECVYTFQMIYTDIAALLQWIIGLSLPIYIVRTALHTLAEREYSFYIYFYELMRPFYSLSAELGRYLHRDEFSRKNF